MAGIDKLHVNKACAVTPSARPPSRQLPPPSPPTIVTDHGHVIAVPLPPLPTPRPRRNTPHDRRQ
ncbi:hypothetical protein E2C01_064454 [Portunus trituberculatus]|uniref:Uncharacterized protein n=1 Tax=Portunus trituberculatus TaxID=210409 RepID=A0A5B7HG80_PORTR|nr:hypothetical protein [Portunus trituberculatus]